MTVSKLQAKEEFRLREKSRCAIQGAVDLIFREVYQMGLRKKIIGFLAILAVVGGSVNQLAAEECYTDTGGCGYEECCRASSLAPAIALGAIAVVAIVAVAVQNTSGHGHCH